MDEQTIEKRIQDHEERLDDHESRLSSIETSQGELKSMVKEGFADVRATFHDIYAEKVAWGEWSRHALTEIGKWLGKWGAIIILVAIGFGNADTILSFFHIN